MLVVCGVLRGGQRQIAGTQEAPCGMALSLALAPLADAVDKCRQNVRGLDTGENAIDVGCDDVGEEERGVGSALF